MLTFWRTAVADGGNSPGDDPEAGKLYSADLPVYLMGCAGVRQRLRCQPESAERRDGKGDDAMDSHGSKNAGPYKPFDHDRREFGRLALTSALGSVAFLGSPRESRAAIRQKPSGIKLCAQSSAKPSDSELRFLRQIGAGFVSVASTPDLRTAEGFMQIKKRYADAGITVWNIGNSDVHNMPEVTLNLPGRDAKIEQYKQYLRNLSKAGIRYTTYAHMGNGIWTSGRAEVRGAPAREFDLSSPEKKGVWGGKSWKEPLSHGRVFTKEEIWENYTYFIKQIVPVAEEAGVRIGIHPDDPPVPVLAGVPRCIFSNFEGYKRALEIANSSNVGICLCCGTWLEGGRRLTGKDPEEMIRYFGAQKIWKIHFRNVSAPLPHFVETFMDDGYYDMYKIMKALRDVDFDGIVILDHSPSMVGGKFTQTAYGFGYMKALLSRANAEARA
jgi:mannonate dehydratase